MPLCVPTPSSSEMARLQFGWLWIDVANTQLIINGVVAESSHHHCYSELISLFGTNSSYRNKTEPSSPTITICKTVNATAETSSFSSNSKHNRSHHGALFLTVLVLH